MSDAPDLSKIVNLIMENPSLIAEISALAKKDAESEGESVAPESVPSAAPPSPEGTRRIHRSRLIGAMKPYLSEERQRAVDTMMTIVDILDAQRGGV